MLTNATEVYKQFMTAQEKYIYFLLAVTGSSIALSVSRTVGLQLSYLMIPLGLAVILWGVSFFCGCRRLDLIRGVLYSNMQYIKAQCGLDPIVGRDLDQIEFLVKMIRDEVDIVNKKLVSFANLQFMFFMLGGVSWIGWNVIEMIEKSL